MPMSPVTVRSMSDREACDLTRWLLELDIPPPQPSIGRIIFLELWDSHVLFVPAESDKKVPDDER